MSETINTYSLDNPYEEVPMDRKEFYAEQETLFKETGKTTKATEVIHVLLFNESGEMILQKRASTKGHNPNLLDKAIGGHIVHGDTPEYTVMVEMIQELQVPSIVLENHEDFEKTILLLSKYTNSIAIVEKIDVKLTNHGRIMNKERIILGNKVHIYFGVYGGSVKNVDKEAKGILFYNLEELEEEMKDFPDIFTEDIFFYFKEYKEKIYDFREFILKK